MAAQDRFIVRRYGEARTGCGQLLDFSCPPDVFDQVKQFLAENIHSVDIPVTGRVNVPHGGYGQYTRYDIQQHRYAGGGPGYIEVLEVRNAPEERWGIIINEWNNYQGGVFTEWETVETACAAWERCWSSADTMSKFAKLPGFKRSVTCGALTPWFYAVGEEQLIGDYTFPERLQNDPVFRFGRQFVVFDKNDVPAIKTCMGTRFVTRKEDYHPYKEYQTRLVYWDDGSLWDESHSSGGSQPRPVQDGEMWVVEALQQFGQLLAGKRTEFTINFTDGNKFVGKLRRPRNRVPCAAGDYYLVVRVKGSPETKKGWVYDFVPTLEVPDIIQHVTQLFAQRGQEVEYIEIKESKTKDGGKKWAGAFFAPSK